MAARRPLVVVSGDARELPSGDTLTPLLLLPVAVALTDAATVATDASAGEVFTLDMTSAVGNTRVIGAPTNARDTMRCTWRIRQDATGGRSFTLASGTGGFVLGSLIPNVTPNTAANKVAYLTAIYDASYPGGARWCVLSFEPGV